MDEIDEAIMQMLLSGEAETAHEAEAKYLDAHLRDVIDLADAGLTDDEFREHPLIVLLMSHGSRGAEDSLR
jgi:hypothetical protein